MENNFIVFEKPKNISKKKFIMHIFMHCIVFGFGLARNIENENNNLGRHREKGITPDQLPLFLDMARLCNSVFYPNER